MRVALFLEFLEVILLESTYNFPLLICLSLGAVNVSFPNFSPLSDRRRMQPPTYRQIEIV